MRRQKQPEPPTDERLREVLYGVREGLRKLVPASWGSPPYTRYGSMNSEHSSHFDPEAKPYLMVSLRVWHAASDGWTCYISIADGDDFSLQRFLPFTWENWCGQVNTYDQITTFDQDMYSLLLEDGFS
jgi:hypothetical protein